MKRTYLLLIMAAILAVFSACGSDDLPEAETPSTPPVDTLPPLAEGEIAISFEGCSSDTLAVNENDLPNVTVLVRSDKALAFVQLLYVKQDNSTSEIKKVSSFDTTVYRATLTPAELGLNRFDIAALRVAAEDVEQNYQSKQLYYRFIDPSELAPQVRFTNVQDDTLKVNTDPNAAKPTPCFEVSGVMDTVRLYILKKGGIAQQHGNTVTSFTAGENYASCFENISYTEDMVGLRIYASNNGKATILDLPLKVWLDLNAAPLVKFLTGSPMRLNTHADAIKPYVQLRVTSSVGLQKLVLWRVNNDTEIKMGEITSFGNSKDFTRELTEMTSTTFSGLEKIIVDAYDLAGKFTKAELPVERFSEAPIADENIAFPGADGFAASTTTGGRGGSVYYVTNLNDAGAGSLRDAVNGSNRIVVFKVSGIIALARTLSINGSNITIAGQTAPGDGICIKNYGVQLSGSNVIIRYMRFRMGDEKGTEADALEGRNQSNIIIDHCSMSWSTDECSSFYDNTNFTMQWCYLTESLRISTHAKGAHGYGGIWGGKGASFHHNLLAHHDSRNPRFCGSRYSKLPDMEKCDMRNNVIFNWGGNSGYAGEGGSYNFVNNYYKPAGGTVPRNRIFSPNGQDQTQGNQQPGNVWGKFWLGGNFVDGDAAATADNWLGLQPNPSSGSPLPGSSKESLKLAEEFSVPQKLTHTATTAYERVLAYGGASYMRDKVDGRIVNEVSNGLAPVRAYYTLNAAQRPSGTPATKSGMIDTQADVGGWPTYESYPAPLQSKNDGIPDAWKAANGLSLTDNVANAKTLSAVYTNLEVYLNSIVDHITREQQK